MSTQVAAFRSWMHKMRGADFVRHGLVVFVGLMAANVLQFGFYFLLSRAVSIEQYGVLSSLFSAALLLATGPATVAGTIVARLAADLQAVGDVAKLRRLGDVINAGSVGVGLIGFTVIALCARPIAAFLHLAKVEPVILTGIVLAFSIAIPVQRGVLQGAERFGDFALSSVVEAAAKVLAGPLLALRFDIDGALAGLSLACLCAWAFNVQRLRRTTIPAAPLRLDFRRIVTTSANVSVAVLAVNTLLFYDVILVRHFFSARTAGLYGAAALSARALYMIIAFIPTVVLPKATARRRSGARTRPLLLASIVTATSIVFLALVSSAVLPRAIVSFIAGRAYAEAGPFVFSYMLALGALALANVVTMYNIGMHRFDFVAPLALIASAEIGAVAIWHDSVYVTLTILCVGHGLALAATLIRFRPPLGAARTAAPIAP